jgi:hypothetical protein
MRSTRNTFADQDNRQMSIVGATIRKGAEELAFLQPQKRYRPEEIPRQHPRIAPRNQAYSGTPPREIRPKGTTAEKIHTFYQLSTVIDFDNVLVIEEAGVALIPCLTSEGFEATKRDAMPCMQVEEDDMKAAKGNWTLPWAIWVENIPAMKTEAEVQVALAIG